MSTGTASESLGDVIRDVLTAPDSDLGDAFDHFEVVAASGSRLGDPGAIWEWLKAEADKKDSTLAWVVWQKGGRKKFVLSLKARQRASEHDNRGSNGAASCGFPRPTPPPPLSSFPSGWEGNSQDMARVAWVLYQRFDCGQASLSDFRGRLSVPLPNGMGWQIEQSAKIDAVLEACRRTGLLANNEGGIWHVTDAGVEAAQEYGKQHGCRSVMARKAALVVEAKEVEAEVEPEPVATESAANVDGDPREENDEEAIEEVEVADEAQGREVETDEIDWSVWTDDDGGGDKPLAIRTRPTPFKVRQFFESEENRRTFFTCVAVNGGRDDFAYVYLALGPALRARFDVHQEDLRVMLHEAVQAGWLEHNGGRTSHSAYRLTDVGRAEILAEIEPPEAEIEPPSRYTAAQTLRRLKALEDALREARAEVEQLRAALTQAENDRDAFSDEVETLRLQLDQVQAELNAAQEHEEALTAESQTLRAQ